MSVIRYCVLLLFLLLLVLASYHHLKENGDNCTGWFFADISGLLTPPPDHYCSRPSLSFKKSSKPAARGPCLGTGAAATIMTAQPHSVLNCSPANLSFKKQTFNSPSSGHSVRNIAPAITHTFTLCISTAL